MLKSSGTDLFKRVGQTWFETDSSVQFEYLSLVQCLFEGRVQFKIL